MDGFVVVVSLPPMVSLEISPKLTEEFSSAKMWRVYRNTAHFLDGRKKET